MVRELAMWATAQASVNALAIGSIFCLILQATRPAERISLRRALVITIAVFFWTQFLSALSVTYSLFLHRFTTFETIFRMAVAQTGSIFVLYLIHNIRDTIESSRGDEASKEWGRILEQDKMQNRESRRITLARAGDLVLQEQQSFMQRANG